MTRWHDAPSQASEPALNRDTTMLIGALGADFLGAVFLAGLIASGIAYGRAGVVGFALLSAGLGYLVQVGQFLIPPRYAGVIFGLWAASAIAAVISFLLLIGG